MPTAKMSNAIYDTQAAFDPTICFTVYGSWIEAIEEVETASDRDSLAYQMFKAIANYSMYGEEPNFDNAPLRAWWRVTARGIDSSMGRRRKKFAPEEVTERERIVIDALIRHPDASIRDIWQETGVHRSSVDRIRKKYRAIIEQGQTANFHTNDSACNSDSHSCNIVIVLARRDSETAKYSRSAQMLSLTFPTERVQTIIIMHMALEPGGIICTINGNKLLQTRKSVLFWINIFLLMQSPQCSRD